MYQQPGGGSCPVHSSAHQQAAHYHQHYQQAPPAPHSSYHVAPGGGGAYGVVYGGGGYGGSVGALTKAQKKKKNRGCYIITTCIVLIIGFMLFGAAVVAPQYHHTTLMSGANTIAFNVGLMRVWAEGRCENRIIKIEALEKFCLAMTETVNGRTLASLEAYACMADSIMFQIVPTGCDTLGMLRVASFTLMFFLIFSTIMYFLSGFLFLAFWLHKQSKKMRIGALMTSGMAAAFSLCGMLIYTLVGGTGLKFSIPLVAQDFSDFDLSTGFMILVFAVAWACMTPMVYVITMPRVVIKSSSSDENPYMDPYESLLPGGASSYYY